MGRSEGQVVIMFRNKWTYIGLVIIVVLVLCALFAPWIAPEAFTKLSESHQDLLQQAKDGVLYLQEVGNLNKLEQRGLLLLLGKLEKFNVRLVCATTKDLPDMVERGAFDSGLFQSLSVLNMVMKLSN